MRILVVDDELVSRKKLQKILSYLGECGEVEDGKSAIGAFKEALKAGNPFDLITLDISMPEMDGTEVLMELRELEKQAGVTEAEKAVIMMVTSHSEKQQIVTSISAGCDDYIIKPFNKKTVFMKLDNSRLKDRLLTDDENSAGISPTKTHRKAPPIDPVRAVIKAFDMGAVDLPPLPQVSVEFNRIVKRGVDVQQTVKLLKQDISLSTKLIRVANSALFGSVSRTTNLEQAVNRLGLISTKQYVDTLCARDFFSSRAKKYISFFESLWQHSHCCAIVSQSVSEILKLQPNIDMFTAGLLHDIGKVILLQGISELERKGKFKSKIDPAASMESIDKRHNDFGAKVLRNWNFEEGYAQIALYHDNLEAVNSPPVELLVVHLSNLITKIIVYSQFTKTEINVDNLESAQLLGITPEHVVEIETRINNQLDILGSSFD